MVKHSHYPPDAVFIEDAGWHFSYLGGTELVAEKLDSITWDPNDYGDRVTDRKNIAECIATGRDLFGRDREFRFVEIDETFPRYVRENMARLSKYIKPFNHELTNPR